MTHKEKNDACCQVTFIDYTRARFFSRSAILLARVIPLPRMNLQGKKI